MAENFELLKHNLVSAKSLAEDYQTTLATERKPLEEKIAQLEKEFAESNAELIENVRQTAEAAGLADARIRDAAIEAFTETGEKQLGFGVSIRVNEKYEYEESKAVGYAIGHDMPHLLKVDATKFKKFASVTPLDFVSIEQVPVAVIGGLNKE